MTRDGATQKPKLWKECYRILTETKGVWGYWVLGVSLVQSLLNTLIQKDLMGKVPMQDQIDQMTSEEKKHMLATLFTPDFFVNMIEAGLIFFLIQVVAIYIFTVVYLQHVAPNSRVSFSLNGFFFWLKNAVVAYIALPLGVCGVLFALSFPIIVISNNI